MQEPFVRQEIGTQAKNRTVSAIAAAWPESGSIFGEDSMTESDLKEMGILTANMLRSMDELELTKHSAALSEELSSQGELHPERGEDLARCFKETMIYCIVAQRMGSDEVEVICRGKAHEFRPEEIIVPLKRLGYRGVSYAGSNNVVPRITWRATKWERIKGWFGR